MPEPLYGIPREQHRTDVPARRIESLDTGATVSRRTRANGALVTGVLLLLFLLGAFLFGVGVSTEREPIPSPASREAVLERQVGDLSTHVADLKNRNRATLEALAGSPALPTKQAPAWIYDGPYQPANKNAR